MSDILELFQSLAILGVVVLLGIVFLEIRRLTDENEVLRRLKDDERAKRLRMQNYITDVQHGQVYSLTTGRPQ